MNPLGWWFSTGCLSPRLRRGTRVSTVSLWPRRHRTGMAGKVSGSSTTGDESLVEYIGELRMLASRAFPGWSEEQCDVLIRNQFIQGVSSSSIQVQLLKRCQSQLRMQRPWHADWKRWRWPIGVYKRKELRKDH